ncbi:MAG: MmcQ/YjbR family DNA-binding protein [Chloroflexota bacterium]
MDSYQIDDQAITAYCLSKPGVTSGYPFGEGTLVFKVINKMFALISEDSEPLGLNLKCDPDDALALREQHKAINPGYHMNKKHWNTLTFDSSLPEKLVYELIDHSYDLVVSKLSKNDRQKLSHWNLPKT